jgi:TatD DNase family protein
MAAHASRISVALGLHPELARQRASELPLFRELLPQTRYVGEIGLDHVTIDTAERATQRRVFDTIIGWCDEATDKVLTIHSRRAADDVVDAVGSSFRGSWILHWYSGSKRTLGRAVASGAYVSVNPAMLRSEKGRSLLSAVPRERILTETDGPFIERRTGEPAEPPDVSIVLEGLAQMWGIDTESTRGRIYANFGALIGDSGKPI